MRPVKQGTKAAPAHQTHRCAIISEVPVPAAFRVFSTSLFWDKDFSGRLLASWCGQNLEHQWYSSGLVLIWSKNCN